MSGDRNTQRGHDMTLHWIGQVSAVIFSTTILVACSGEDTAAKGAQKESASPVQAAPMPTPAPTLAAQLGETAASPRESLARDWSANGFEQLPDQYAWSGSGKRDADFQPHLSLSVPETDDGILASECLADGRVKIRLFVPPPEQMADNRVTMKFETDTSAKTLTYDAAYLADGQYDGFEIVLKSDDAMFADMKSGSWAYIQVGEGPKAPKLRISLTNAAMALDAFLPACVPSNN
jgi:hypothetical protein